MEADRQHWDDRYEGQGLASPRPPDVLDDAADLLALLPAGGTAVDIACGAGAQSLWLAGLGYDVVALDVSPVAIELTRSAAAEHALEGRIDARVVDLDDGLPADLHDVAVVVCQRFRARGLDAPIIEVVSPGGLVIVTVLSVVGAAGQPGAFHAPPGELLDAFTRRDVEILHHAEGNGSASIVARRV
ncbi:MAG: methyltransferase domain-containing protein [Ilumatobacteraceae bacterium]